LRERSRRTGTPRTRTNSNIDLPVVNADHLMVMELRNNFAALCLRLYRRTSLDQVANDNERKKIAVP
jgi:hypothetical protein